MGTSSPANVFSLGRCNVTLGTTALGITEQVKITMSKTTHLVMSEAYAAPVDAIDGGWAVAAEFMLTEADLDLLDLLDGVSKVAAVIGTGTTTYTKAYFGKAGGTAATGLALSFVSTVTARASLFDFTIYKAVLDSCEPVIQFNPEESALKQFSLRFVGLIDSSKGAADLLGAFGNVGVSTPS
jgi:protein involved in ribonucleotide reduction